MAVLTLAANGRIEPAPLLALLAAHAIPGAEVAEPAQGRHSRLVRTPFGTRRVDVRVGADSVELTAAVPDGGAELEALAQAVRHWLDLDADTGRIAADLGNDPVVGRLVRARPDLRVVHCLDGFEAAITTVLGQQVSVGRARTFGGRLVAAYGNGEREGLALFPSPEDIAGAPLAELRAAVGLTGARAAAVQAVAAAFADGLVLSPEAGFAQARSRLLAIRGVGPWTADYLAVRALADPDAFAPGDLALQRALGRPGIKAAEALSEAWRPWRAYALFHLWTASTYS